MNKSKLSWIRNPLFYVPLIGICVYLVFFRPHSNNIVNDKDIKVECTITSSPQTQVSLICWVSDRLLVENAAGDRFAVSKEDVSCTNSIILKKFNPDYEYYIKMESPETLFRNMTIDEVVQKVGSYIYADVAKGEYSFPQVVAIHGKTRYHGLVIFTGKDGKVASVKLNDKTSSNWFGALPFYADIVSLNMYTAGSQPILQDVPEPEESKGVLMWLLVAAWNIVKFILAIILYFLFSIVVFAVPLCILFPILRLLSLMKSASNILVSTVVWSIGLAVVYVMVIAQVDGTHSLWLITLPINVFVGIMLIAYFCVTVSNSRCPECRKEQAFISNRKAISQHTLTEEKDHAKKGDLNYIGRKGGRKIYERELNCSTTEQKIITTEYQVTDTCMYCGYTRQYTTSETEKGELVETDNWNESITVTKRINPERVSESQSDYTRIGTTSIQDKNGACYDEVGTGESASGNIVEHNGSKYKMR